MQPWRQDIFNVTFPSLPLFSFPFVFAIYYFLSNFINNYNHGFFTTRVNRLYTNRKTQPVKRHLMLGNVVKIYGGHDEEKKKARVFLCYREMKAAYSFRL